jgi:hypothetical protein
MKINYKKITAVLTSSLMAVSGIALAAAASYPGPFVTSGTANAAVVYGTGTGVSSLDSVNAGNIQSDLNDLVTGTTSAPTEEFVKIEKSSTKFELGYGIRNVFTTAITDDSPENGLPTLLANGVFVDNDNDEFDYTQKLELGNLYLNMWADSDYELGGVEQGDNPTVGIKINSSTNVFNYTLDFTDTPLWSDLSYSNIELMGKNYFILSYTNATKLTMLDSATSTVLSEGETTTVNGHTVAINFIGSSTVKLDIDGMITNTLSAGGTQKLSDGSYVGIKEINTQDYAGGVKNVEFSIGSGKLELTSGSDVKLNDVTITGLQATLNHTGSSTGDKISAIKLRWDAEDDLFITPQQEITMPGFGGIKLTFTGMVYPDEEIIEVVAGGDDYIMLNNFPMAGTVADINLVYSADNKNFTAPGKDSSHLLATTNNTDLLYFNYSIHDALVMSWNDTSSAESYLIRFTSFAKDSDTQKNTTTVQYHKDGEWVDKKTGAENADTVSFGNAELTIDYIDYATKSLNVSVGATSGCSFNRLFSEKGLMIYLPYLNETSVTGSANAGMLNASSGTYDINFIEEDKNGNLAAGHHFNVTLGFDSSSTAKVQVSDVVGEEVGFDEIQDTDVWRSFMYSDLATEFLWDKPSGVDSIKLVYHGEESYGEVYVTAEASTTTTSGGALLVTDAEISSVSSKNLIVVGGSCINSAAASLVGGSHCGPAWTSATGVGSGQFLIKAYPSSTITSKLALLVAGYDAADTQNAATYLRTQTVDTSKEYLGTSSTSATVVVA